MISPSVRNSKRLALGGVLAAGLLLICLLAVKDMNDKLGVMTASNAGYQKMTDSQAEKIHILSAELEALRASKISELKAAEEEKRLLEVQLEDLQKSSNQEKQECLDKVEELNEGKSLVESEMKQVNERQKLQADQLTVQLRDQIARISMEKDNCHRQYDALFKLHQEASDNEQRLQQQLTESHPSLSMTKSSKLLQMPEPDHARAKSSSIHPVGLEEPRLGAHLSTSKGGSPANVAPVGAQPPIHGQAAEVVLPHQVRKEDVMEAPKVIQSHFENLDAQVDPVHQDHPGLQAPVYRDNQNVAFDDDLEDTADGMIPHVYTNEKNARYDHSDLDYDFQADFQPHPKQLQQPSRQKIFVRHQAPLPLRGNHQQLQQQRYLSPGGGIVQSPIYRNRGL